MRLAFTCLRCAFVVLGMAIFVTGCNQSSESLDSGGGNLDQQADPIAVMAEAADIVETIKDPQSLQAADSKLRALQIRFARVRPVLTTAVYISGEFPAPDPSLKAQMAEQARANPEFQPYLPQAESLARDRQAQRVPGATTVISEYISLTPGR